MLMYLLMLLVRAWMDTNICEFECCGEFECELNLTGFDSITVSSGLAGAGVEVRVMVCCLAGALSNLISTSCCIPY